MSSLVNEGPLDLLVVEHAVLDHWERREILSQVARRRKDGQPWVTYEGPPTANGAPALHHVWTSTYKDVYARFQVLRGRRVDRRAGWDCQGLPVEIAVEKKFGLQDKKDIERFGIAEFVAECRKLVEENIDRFESVLARAGFWVDYDRAYRTMDDSYVESVWWHLHRLWELGLVFEGHKVVPYCIRCGTALSSHELGQPGVYRDRTDQAAYVALPLAGRDASIVVWTTTPWTLSANVAVAVHPEYTYGLYEFQGRRLIILPERAPEIVGDLAPVETMRGDQLVGERYERPYPEVAADVVGRVVGWSEVAVDVGSGAVHLAPAFGEEDAQVGVTESLPTVNPVDAEGRFTEGPFTGRHALEAVPDIVDDLQKRDVLVLKHDVEHSYPHCWRCATPLIYWAKPTWFVRTSEQASRFVEENETINWYPENIKHGRFGNWLLGNVDWSISRDRFWGTPLPIWRCENGHDTCVDGRARLSELTSTDQSSASLHRPEVDGITFPCPQCGVVAQRVESVADVWMDSGCMPAAQLAHPVSGTLQPGTNYPADFICEAIDQTRGWFYSMLAVNTMVFGSTPYRNAVCLGLLVDDQGRKMSKSVGNVIDPVELIDQFGADAVRWYLLSSGAPWGTRRISREAIEQRRRRDLDTLWNVLSFYRRYAQIEEFVPSDEEPKPSHVLDRWILSRAADLVERATDGLETYQAHRVAEFIAEFIDDLSNWYVRRSRRRFWGMEGVDHAPFQTLHDVLAKVAVVIAPFCPFFAEAMYDALGLANEETPSVHLAEWPNLGGATARSVELEQHMASARRIASLARSARASAGVQIRQPLRSAVVTGVSSLPDEVYALVLDETNILELTFGDDVTVPVHYELQPNWRRVGPRYKSLMGEIKDALRSVSEDEVKALLAGKPLVMTIQNQQVHLDPEDVAVKESIDSSWAMAEEGNTTVAIDTTVDDELRQRFEQRQAVRNIQIARREAGLAITDRLILWLAPHLWAGRAEIASEVLATEVHPLDAVPQDEPRTWVDSEFAFRVVNDAPVAV